MRDQIINLETAKLAKEKGFNVRVNNYHHPQYGVMEAEEDDANFDDFNRKEWAPGYYSAPSQSLLQKWLREEHNIHVFNVGSPKYGACVMFENSNYYRQEDELTYEEALEAGLQAALKLIK